MDIHWNIHTIIQSAYKSMFHFSFIRVTKNPWQTCWTWPANKFIVSGFSLLQHSIDWFKWTHTGTNVFFLWIPGFPDMFSAKSISGEHPLFDDSCMFLLDPAGAKRREWGCWQLGLLFWIIHPSQALEVVFLPILGIQRWFFGPMQIHRILRCKRSSHRWEITVSWPGLGIKALRINGFLLFIGVCLNMG